ncbi:MAG: Acyl carrier protein phosphodiesterase [Pseudomonadales bacterium]|nr:Acyl carrier protein phosphodiesterase [Pseudomonadales bacterium]
MNHLAHFHLAAGCEHLVVGALLGDYLKGPLRGTLSPALERGVRLHRRIDALTDTDHGLRALRAGFAGPERRLAGIALDVFLDYLLTRHWRRFATTPLPVFAAEVCATLDRHRDCLPPPARRQAGRIVEHALLLRYGEAAIIDGTLEHLGTRLGRSEAMRSTVARAWERIDEIEAVFLALYPRLQAVAAAAEFRGGFSAG